MTEIDFSTMSYEPSVGNLEALLREFETRHRVRVRVQGLGWPTAWTEVMKYTIYGHGPAVSEVGSTWIATLVAMNALRPFTPAEVSTMGGASAFLPALWHSGTLDDPLSVWAVPWLAEVRVIYYRRDWLAAAGVDERTAFQSQEHLEQALERLHVHGISAPWVVPTATTLDTLHSLASWVWGAGGDFIDQAGRQVLFDQAKALAGIRAYYSLHRFLPPERPALDEDQAAAMFAEGRAALTISGPWLLLDPALAAQVGIALPPGVPHVSGSHLVIWQSVASKHMPLAIELVRYLTAQAAQLTSSRQVGMLPARTEVLGDPSFADSPSYQVMSRGLQTGRSFPSFRLWSLIEERLTSAFGSIWQRVLADPDADLAAVIRARLDPVAQRLNTILEDT